MFLRSSSELCLSMASSPSLSPLLLSSSLLSSMYKQAFTTGTSGIVHRSLNERNTELSIRQDVSISGSSYNNNRKHLQHLATQLQHGNDDDDEKDFHNSDIDFDKTVQDVLLKAWDVTLTPKEMKLFKMRILQQQQQPWLVKDTLLSLNFTYNANHHQYYYYEEILGYMSRARRKQMLLRHATLLARALSNPNLTTVQDILIQKLNMTTTTTSTTNTAADDNPKQQQLIQRLLLFRRRHHGSKNVARSLTSKRTTPLVWSRSNVKRFLNIMLYHPSYLQLSIEELRHVLHKAPQLLNYRSTNIQRTLHYLLHVVGLTRHEVTVLLRSRPMVLTYSVTNQLHPVLYFVQEELSNSEWKRIITKYPQILQIAVPKLQEQLKGLEQLLRPSPSPPLISDDESHTSNDLSQQQTPPPFHQQDHYHHHHEGDPVERHRRALAPFGVRHMCALYPPLLWLSPSLLQSKMDFFQQEELLHMNTTEVQIMMTAFPQVLGLSVEHNLRPKVNFLLQQLYHPLQQQPGGNTNTSSNNINNNNSKMGAITLLKEWILYQPSLLAYSLHNRIQPRVAILQEHDIALCYSPPYLMSLTDAKFMAWVDMHRTTWTTTTPS